MQNSNDLMIDDTKEDDHALTGCTVEEAVAFWKLIFASFPTMDDVVQGMGQVVIETNKLAEE